MPLYEYKCESGHVFEKRRPYEHRHDSLECPICHTPMRLIPSVAFIFTDTNPVVDSIAVDDRTDYQKRLVPPPTRRELEKKGIVPWEPGMDKDIKQARKYQEEKTERGVKEFVEREFVPLLQD